MSELTVAGAEWTAVQAVVQPQHQETERNRCDDKLRDISNPESPIPSPKNEEACDKRERRQVWPNKQGQTAEHTRDHPPPVNETDERRHPQRGCRDVIHGLNDLIQQCRARGNQHGRHHTGDRARQAAARHKRQPYEQRARNRRKDERRIETANCDERREQQRKTWCADGRRRGRVGFGRDEAARRERARRVRPWHLRRELAGWLERARRECVGHQRIARRIRSAGRVGAPAESDNGNG